MRKRVLFNDNRINRTSTPAIGFISLSSPSLYGRNSIYHLKPLHHSLPPKRKKKAHQILMMFTAETNKQLSPFSLFWREILNI